MAVNYYYKLTNKPMPGMIYWKDENYLHPVYCNDPAMPVSVQMAHRRYILRIESSYTILADTDAGCDRTCDQTDYQPLSPKNIIMDGDHPIGVYLDLGYYYSVSPDRPNVMILPFEESASYYHSESGTMYTLIPYDPEKSYASSSRVY